MRFKNIYKKLRIELPLMLFLGGLALRPLDLQATSLAPALLPSKECARGRNPRSYFPFPGQREVTIYGDARARKGIAKSSIEEVANNWNTACQKGPNVPHFVVDWEHDRPSSEDPGERNKIFLRTFLIILSTDEEAKFETQTASTPVAAWSSTDNSTKLLGKCGNRTIKKPCNMPLEKGESPISIAWQSDWGSMAMTHEIGHVLGLDDDLKQCKIPGVMRAIVDKKDTLRNLPIHPEYCRLVNDINNVNALCATIQTNSTEHPCNDPEFDHRLMFIMMKIH